LCLRSPTRGQHNQGKHTDQLSPKPEWSVMLSHGAQSIFVTLHTRQSKPTTQIMLNGRRQALGR
jgi:hypothetical protein